LEVAVGPAFQIWIFLVASAVNFALTFVGLIGLVIRFFTRIAARKSATVDAAAVGKSVKDATEAAVQKELGLLSQSHPIGRVIGFLECELYLYGLLTSQGSIISGVLLFKAFSGWLGTPAESDSVKTLARFCAYAIGNFTSLLSAVVIFEGIRLLMRVYPQLYQALWIG
jgi:hypothetical protein